MCSCTPMLSTYPPVYAGLVAEKKYLYILPLPHTRTQLEYPLNSGSVLLSFEGTGMHLLVFSHT